MALGNLEVFCRTYELGSFTRAASALGLTPQAASRALARLETRVGATLFRRTTRSLEPTEAGRAYYATCRAALDLLARGERELSQSAHAETGTIAISVGTTWAHQRFLPALARFRRTAPGINLLVQIDHRNIDFVKDGFDLAIRLGAIRDQTLVARKLADCALGVYASPAYLREHPAPRTPDELASHACIGFVMPSTGRVLPWQLGGGLELVPPTPVRVAGDVLGTITLARAGAGLVQIYDDLVADAVARGELVEVLAAHRGATRPFSLLYPRALVQPPAVKKLVAFLVAEARHGRGGNDS